MTSSRQGANRRLRTSIAFVVVGLLASVPVGVRSSAAASDAAVPTVRVDGNHLVDGSGARIRLLGVNRSGTDYACWQGWAMTDGPTSAKSVQPIVAWHANAIRLAVNPDCWLRINGVKPEFSGRPYRQMLHRFIGRLQQAGLIVLPVAFSREQSLMATEQWPDFWKSFASEFRDNPGLIFDLYNEPHEISWKCWRDGCTTHDGVTSVGEQQMVDAIRGTGATQPILLEGLNYDSDITRMIKYLPSDPAHQLVASLHEYNFDGCDHKCWNTQYRAVGKAMPIVTGELGEDDCATGFITRYMKWADAHGVSYLGWTWNAGGGWTCEGGPTLITSYGGTPTGMGIGLRDHLTELAGG